MKNAFMQRLELNSLSKELSRSMGSDRHHEAILGVICVLKLSLGRYSLISLDGRMRTKASIIGTFVRQTSIPNTTLATRISALVKKQK